MDYVDEVREYLTLPPAKKIQVLRELELHYRELKEGLIASGMSESDAAAEAGRRFGDPARLARQLYRVHYPASRYLWVTIGLLLVSFWLAQYSVVGLFLPMIHVINDLTSESGNVSGASAGPAWLFTLIRIAALIASGSTVFLALRGVAGDNRRRIGWVIILLLAVLVLIQAVVAAAVGIVVAPHFQDIYKDLGVQGAILFHNR